MPVGGAQLTGTFRRGFAATFAFDLVSSALAAVTVVVFIRGLSVAGYAYTTLFLTFAQFAGTAASGGVRTRYLREQAERFSRVGGDGPRRAFIESLVKGTLLVVVLGLCGAPIAAAAGIDAGGAGGITFVFAGTGFAVGIAALELTVAHYQAIRRFFAAGVFRVIRAAVLLAAAFAITQTSGSVASISAWLVGSMVAVGLFGAVRVLGNTASTPLRHLHLARFDREEVWLTLYYVASAGFAYVDVMVAGALLHKKEVATLGASLRYLAVVLAAIPALGAILRVRTSQVDLVDSLANQRAMVISWFRRATVPAALLVAVGIVLAPTVIPVIDGGRYPESIRTLQVFLITALSAYLFAPVANILMAQRRYLMLAAIYGAALAVNLVGDIAVARPFGVVGIAIVSTAVYVATDLAMLYTSLRHARA